MARKKRIAGSLSDAARNLGMLVAEQDPNLERYYVGREQYLDKALNIDDALIFFMGPKGIGKSAILQMVRLERARDQKRVIDIAPDDLAFSAFANLRVESPLLMDALRGQWLFKSLWDYVLLMEIWERENSAVQNRIEKFKSLFMKSKDEKRIQRLFQITISDEGETVSFTDRILELIKEVELSAQAGDTEIKGKVSLQHGSSRRFQLLAEINHAVKRLPDVLKHEYYILVDDLDLHWRNEPNQNAFIAALFLSLRKLSRRPIKFLVSIRQDIYNCLPLVDKDKSRDRVCSVEWGLSAIREMIEMRIATSLNCKQTDVWGNLFPEDAFESFSLYSTKKPREFIRFASLCLNRAYINGHKRVHEGDILQAVREHSCERVQDLVSDLMYVYPRLEIVLRKFRGKEKEFPFETLDDIATELALEALERNDAPWFWAGQFDRRGVDFAELLADIGFLQIKENRTAVPKPYDRSSMGQIQMGMWFSVHPMYAPDLELLGT
jgi:hypothetical protein